jgi:hypothetical protein
MPVNNQLQILPLDGGLKGRWGGVLDLRTASYLLHDPRREFDAPLQRPSRWGSGEPIG